MFICICPRAAANRHLDFASSTRCTSSHQSASFSLTFLTHLWFKSLADTCSSQLVFHLPLAWSLPPPLSRSLYNQTKDPLGGKLWRRLQERVTGWVNLIRSRQQRWWRRRAVKSNTQRTQEWGEDKWKYVAAYFPFFAFALIAPNWLS